MVEEKESRNYPIAWSGLITGPTAWAISTQLNYALIPWQCGSHRYAIAWIAFGLVVLALAGGFLSLREWRGQRQSDMGRFAAGIGVLSAALFAAVIVFQATAGLIFTGCER
jgi:hypothetical protein